jgi:hypothetical protein
VNRYEEKKAARAERFKQYAENAEERSRAAFNQADSIASCIPMGQPILVGHHSERRHRRDIERIDGGMRRGIEEQKKAQYWAERAANAEDTSRIDSDNPDAPQLIDDKIAKIERLRDRYKAINALMRKHPTPEAFAAAILEKWPDTKDAPALAHKLLTPDFAGRKGIPGYQLTNMGAEIRRLKERKEKLERIGSFPAFEVNGVGVAVVEGQIQVNFGYKPNESTRLKLKSWPLSLKWSRWSEAWVRKYTGQGDHFINELKKVLEVATP